MCGRLLFPSASTHRNNEDCFSPPDCGLLLTNVCKSNNRPHVPQSHLCYHPFVPTFHTVKRNVTANRHTRFSKCNTRLHKKPTVCFWHSSPSTGPRTKQHVFPPDADIYHLSCIRHASSPLNTGEFPYGATIFVRITLWKHTVVGGCIHCVSIEKVQILLWHGAAMSIMWRRIF